MRKIAWALAAFFVLSLAAAPLAAIDNKDLQVIKKAAQEDPAPAPGRTAKWFKILIQNGRTNRETVRVTLPIALVEIFIKSSRNHCVHLHDSDLDLDLAQIWDELKKLGPMAILEVQDHGELIKIWLE